MVDRKTAGNIVAREDAKTLPTAESPTPTRIAAKARDPRMQPKELKTQQRVTKGCKMTAQFHGGDLTVCIL